MLREFFGKIGNTAAFLLAGTARLGALFADVTKYFFGTLIRPKTLPRETFAYQLMTMGLDSAGIISLVGASVGAVLALQAAYSLKDFGALN